ncbi:hypothetical protein CC2G_003629 [Coprinopsis cinerea AmutBmut pab1-1]|nr:hypothetical protein CC2G_003629 [Coprinopsis cinerea AmutBmut pab1-1]
MPENFTQSWAKLESELFGAVTKLKSKFSAAMVLPFLPWAHGYLLTFKNPRSYDRAVGSSRDWFSIWWGALSYLVAHADSKRDAFTLNSYVPQWHVELESEVDTAWIDGIWFSSICDFSFNPNRIGCIVDIVNPKPYQPTVEWFVKHGVPVWYRWGSSEIASADQRLAPPPGTLTGSPERPIGTRKQILLPHLPTTSSSPPPPDPMASKLSNFNAAWAAHCARHQRAHARIMEKETPTERQAREARAANPPVSKVRVYEWCPSESNPDTYERVAAGVKYSRDTLSLYSSKQKKFDSFCREWDCCDLFSGDDDEIDLEEWSPDDLSLPIPTSLRNKIAEAYNLRLDVDVNDGGAILEQSEGTSLSEHEETCPSAYQPLQIARGSSAIATTIVDEEQVQLVSRTDWLVNTLLEEVNSVFGLHYGFVPPLPSTPVPSEDNDKMRRNFCRLLGLTDNELKPNEYFATAHYKSAVQFMTAHSKRKTPHAGSWDLKDDVISPLKHCSRLRDLRITAIPSFDNLELVDSGQSDCVPRYYWFNFASSTKPWKLAVLNALDALFVCRLPPEFKEDEIVLTLVQKGISFRLFFPRSHLQARRYRTPSYSPLPIRPLKHKFTKIDYDSYVNTRTRILSQPHMRAALRRGGIIWRLAIATLGMGDVEKTAVGCSGLLTTRLENCEGEYVDDGLTARELDLICGAYTCIDEDTGSVAIKSWWPLARAYERSDCGENYGRWCCRREQWYIKRLEDIERGVEKFDQPLAFQEWKSAQRGLGPIRHFHNTLQSASHDFIERFLFSRANTS